MNPVDDELSSSACSHAVAPVRAVDACPASTFAEASALEQKRIQDALRGTIYRKLANAATAAAMLQRQTASVPALVADMRSLREFLNDASAAIDALADGLPGPLPVRDEKTPPHQELTALETCERALSCNLCSSIAPLLTAAVCLCRTMEAEIVKTCLPQTARIRDLTALLQDAHRATIALARSLSPLGHCATIAEIFADLRLKIETQYGLCCVVSVETALPEMQGHFLHRFHRMVHEVVARALRQSHLTELRASVGIRREMLHLEIRHTPGLPPQERVCPGGLPEFRARCWGGETLLCHTEHWTYWKCRLPVVLLETTSTDRGAR